MGHMLTGVTWPHLEVKLPVVEALVQTLQLQVRVHAGSYDLVTLNLLDESQVIIERLLVLLQFPLQPGYQLSPCRGVLQGGGGAGGEGGS